MSANGAVVLREVVLDPEHNATRDAMRQWLSDANRASQLLTMIEQAPHSFRAGLVAVLERLLCGGEGGDPAAAPESGATALVRSRGTEFQRHLVPSLPSARLRISLRDDHVAGMELETCSLVAPRGRPQQWSPAPKAPKAAKDKPTPLSLSL